MILSGENYGFSDFGDFFWPRKSIEIYFPSSWKFMSLKIDFDFRHEFFKLE
jgi:hypothetical protein